MKKFSLPILGTVCLLSLFWCSAQSQKPKLNSNEFTLNAEIKGIKDSYLIYYETNDKESSGYSYDTLRVNNNKFQFKGNTAEYRMYFIDIPQARRSVTSVIDGKKYTSSLKANVNRLWFIGYPGANITYKGEVKKFLVDAYPSDKEGINDDLALIHTKIFPLLDTINGMIIKRIIDKNITSDQLKILNDEVDKLHEEVTKIKIDFIKSNPKSIAATYILKELIYRKEISEEQAVVLFNGFDANKLKGVSFYEEIRARIEAMKAAKIGKEAPELVTSNTLDGTQFKLSALKGKYVLLDYWGSWCGPCMAEIPKIKEYSEKYSTKNLVIVGVNSGDNEINWRNTVKKKEMSWTQIRSTNDKELLTMFNVNSFPTKILIDPQGKIIYSSKDPNLDLYKTLDEIFSK